MSRLSTAARGLLLGSGALCLVSSTPAAAADVKLTVLEKGKAPRQELRFTPAKGSKEQVRMEMQMGTTMTMAGMAMPTMNLPSMYLDIDVEVLDLQANGDIRYAFTIAGTSVGADTDGMPGVSNALDDALAPMVGTRGEVTVSPTGVARDTTLEASAGADPKMVADMKKSMANTSAPLPKEAVGLGAKWQLVTNVEDQGLRISQTATYQITELTPDAVTLAVTLTQTGDAQNFTPEGMPPGSSAALNKLATTGSGTSLLHFDRVMPARAEVSLNTDMDVTISAEGQEMPMNNKLQMTTIIAPR